jgi:hypothetical protein
MLDAGRHNYFSAGLKMWARIVNIDNLPCLSIVNEQSGAEGNWIKDRLADGFLDGF